VVDEQTRQGTYGANGLAILDSSRPSPRAAFFRPIPAGQHKGGKPGHRLLAADLKTGKHIWEQEITADVISAPIVSEGVVYLTCFDGTHSL